MIKTGTRDDKSERQGLEYYESWVLTNNRKNQVEIIMARLVKKFFKVTNVSTWSRGGCLWEILCRVEWRRRYFSLGFRCPSKEATSILISVRPMAEGNPRSKRINHFEVRKYDGLGVTRLDPNEDAFHMVSVHFVDAQMKCTFPLLRWRYQRDLQNSWTIWGWKSILEQ